MFKIDNDHIVFFEMHKKLFQKAFERNEKLAKKLTLFTNSHIVTNSQEHNSIAQRKK